jgi:hypothetical protein
MTRKDFLIGAIVSLVFGFIITLGLGIERRAKVDQHQWKQWVDTADCESVRARARELQP